MSKCLAKLQKCRLCTVHLFPYSKGSNYLWRSNLLEKKSYWSTFIFKTVFCTIFSWNNFGGLSAEVSSEVGSKTSWKYHKIVSNEDRTKHCFKNEWTLQCFYVRKLQENIVKTLLNKIKNAPSERISSHCVQHSFLTF